MRQRLRNRQEAADFVEKLVLLTVGMLAFGLVTEGLARHFSWPFDVLLSLQARVLGLFGGFLLQEGVPIL